MQLADSLAIVAAVASVATLLVSLVLIARAWPRIRPEHLEEITRLIDESRDKQARTLKLDVETAIGPHLRDIRLELSRLREAVDRPLASDFPKVPAGVPVVGVAGPAEISEKPFVDQLIEGYNSLRLEDFRKRFIPRSAQFDNSQFSAHGAGSFWIVESPSGEAYALPRPRKITPIHHDNVGLRHVFAYTGYNPTGPEQSFCLDSPAVVCSDSDSRWSLRSPGRLRLNPEEPQQ